MNIEKTNHHLRTSFHIAAFFAFMSALARPHRQVLSPWGLFPLPARFSREYNTHHVAARSLLDPKWPLYTPLLVFTPWDI